MENKQGQIAEKRTEYFMELLITFQHCKVNPEREVIFNCTKIDEPVLIEARDDCTAGADQRHRQSRKETA
jgi:hypothetical protein